ncbi:MAG TPA: hypothetical protein VGG08_10980, partial [Solirubrobacteraceae bacterium]
MALEAANVPSSADIARAEKLVRERFLHDGEDPAVALAPGTPRRRALDAALAEIAADANVKRPSTAWRREFSLLLGLERLLSDEEPKLVDGTVLSAHQVDALSGTLTALLAEAQRSNGDGQASASPELLASADILGPDEDPEDAPSPNGDAVAAEDEDDDEEEDDDELDDDEDEDDDLGPVQRAAPDEDDEDDDEELTTPELEDEDEDEEPEAESDEEPQDWVDDADGDEEVIAEQPEDPNAAKRFWFEHATGAGKTVAALGFVEASQTGGVLILTHRRNLVD